ncbi:hypothetical protein DMENIID0001_009350 [Sergentomyia squamirostris]
MAASLDLSALTDEDVQYELILRGLGPPWDGRDCRSELVTEWDNPARNIINDNDSMRFLLGRVAEFEYNLLDISPNKLVAVQVLYTHLMHRCKYSADNTDPDKVKARKIIRLVDRHYGDFCQRCNKLKDAIAQKDNGDNRSAGRGRNPTSSRTGTIPKNQPRENINPESHFVEVVDDSNSQQNNNSAQFEDARNLDEPSEIAPYSFVRPVPYKDWGISFSGARGSCKVRHFLKDLERMSVAQNVSLQAVNRSIRLFLTGDALTWYNANYEGLSTWVLFSGALRSAFQDFESDFAIRKKIEERKQKVGEPVEVFLSFLYELFEELEEPILEREKIRLIRRNLTADYANALALTDVSTLAQLVTFLKKIETNRLLSAQITVNRGTDGQRNNSRREIHELESETRDPSEVQAVGQSANRGTTPRFRRGNGRSINRNQSRSVNESTTCVNCRGAHNIRDCDKPRKSNVMCYRCGLENTITSRCTACNTAAAGEDQATQ